MSTYEKNLHYAKQGDPLAQSAIIHGCGAAVQYGTDFGDDGYPKDMSVSHYWADKLKESAANGNTLAQYEISSARIDSENIVERLVTTDTAEILLGLQNKYQKIIEEKVKNNDPYALYALGNDKNDLEMLKKSAELGCSLACDRLRRYYCLGGFDGDINFANSQPSMQFYYSKKGTETNDLYTCRSQYNLALCYNEGIGVERDQQQYVFWLNKAAGNGHYDAIERYKRISSNNNTANNSNSGSSQSGGGCYVATCVYGSYDCPQVWTLRRFRDYKLMNSDLGKSFVKFYYKVSPKLVEKYGAHKWFNVIFKSILDKFIVVLKKKGYQDTKYSD